MLFTSTRKFEINMQFQVVLVKKAWSRAKLLPSSSLVKLPYLWVDGHHNEKPLIEFEADPASSNDALNNSEHLTLQWKSPRNNAINWKPQDQNTMKCYNLVSRKSIKNRGKKNSYLTFFFSDPCLCFLFDKNKKWWKHVSCRKKAFFANSNFTQS